VLLLPPLHSGSCAPVVQGPEISCSCCEGIEQKREREREREKREEREREEKRREDSRDREESREKRNKKRPRQEPRKVLQEFGLEVPNHVSIRVHDSTADLRFLVLPRRPAFTEGWTEDQLKTIVSRDSMIGVAVPVVNKTASLFCVFFYSNSRKQFELSLSPKIIFFFF